MEAVDSEGERCEGLPDGAVEEVVDVAVAGDELG